MVTISTTPRSTTYTIASASAGPFLVGFRVVSTDPIEVYVNDILRTDYTLTVDLDPDFDDAASITFDADLKVSDVLLIVGDEHIERQADYGATEPDLTGKLNAELGPIVAEMRELYEKAGRTIRCTTAITPLQVGAADRASRALTFSADGSEIEAGPTVDEISSAQTYAEQAEYYASSIQPYASRAAFEAATIPAAVIRSSHYTPSGEILNFVRDASGTAITSSGGAKWSPPAYEETPNHWAENTTPGTTDMRAAIVAAWEFGPERGLRFLGETYNAGVGVDLVGEETSGIEQYRIRAEAETRLTTTAATIGTGGYVMRIRPANDSTWMEAMQFDPLEIHMSGGTATDDTRGLWLRRHRDGNHHQPMVNGPTRPFYLEGCPQLTFFNPHTRCVARAGPNYRKVTFNSNLDVDGDTDTITATAHGLSNGDLVRYYASLGEDIGPGDEVQCYVVGATANTFQLSATSGGAAISLTPQTPAKTQYVVRDGEEAKAAWTLREYNGTNCYDLTLVNGQSEGGADFQFIFDMDGLDLLRLTGGHFNNCNRRIKIDMDGTAGQRNGFSLFADNTHWDGEGACLGFFYINTPDVGSGRTVRLENWQLNGGIIRRGERLFEWGDLSGLEFFKSIQIKDVNFKDIDEDGTSVVPMIDLSGAPVDDPRLRFIDWDVSSNTIHDGNLFSGAPHQAPFFKIGGSQIRVCNNGIRGNWNDFGDAPFEVGANADGVRIAVNEIDVARTEKITVAASATNVVSYGNEPGFFDIDGYRSDIFDWPSRDDLVAQIAAMDAAGQAYRPGQRLFDGSVEYVVTSGATEISDLPGLKWCDGVSPDHFSSSADMTSAVNSALYYGMVDGVPVKFLGKQYSVNGSVGVAGNVDDGSNITVHVEGVGSNLSIILQNDPDADTLCVQRGFGNDSGWMRPIIRDLGIEYSGATSANTGKGLRLNRCLYAEVESCEVNGAPYNYWFENVGRSDFRSISSRALAFSSGSNAPAAITITDNGEGRCFNLNFEDPEIASTTTRMTDVAWDVQACDTMRVQGGHTNHCVKRVKVNLDNTTWQTNLFQTWFTDHYFDGNGSPADCVTIEATDPGALGASTRIEGLYFKGCFFRVGSGNVISLDSTAAGVAGLSTLQDIKIIDCEVQDFDGSFVSLVNSNITATNVISNVDVVGNLIEDGPTVRTNNPVSVHVSGKNVRVADNTWQGDGWDNGGGALVQVDADSENVIVSGSSAEVQRDPLDWFLVDSGATSVSVSHPHAMTFTPQLRFGTTAIEDATTPGTYATQRGEVQLMGNVAHFFIEIELTAKGDATGLVQLSLPSQVPLANDHEPLNFGRVAAFSGLNSLPFANTEASQSEIVLREMAASGNAQAALTEAKVTDTTHFTLAGTLRTNWGA